LWYDLTFRVRLVTSSRFLNGVICIDEPTIGFLADVSQVHGSDHVLIVAADSHNSGDRINEQLLKYRSFAVGMENSIWRKTAY
jgi:hypothetical protein